MKVQWTLSTVLIAVAMLTGCAVHKVHNLPPAQQLMEPGPGVGGPGPGVITPAERAGGPAGAISAAGAAMYGGGPMVGPGCYDVGGAGCVAPAPTVQILFNKPAGMQVRYDIGSGNFASAPLVVPARNNFPQGGIYRLKVTNIEGREGVELYPSLEIGPATPRTEAYLAHNAIPIQFTDEDFDQVMTGNFVTKVIYLPDPEFQDLALANVETLVSTRLDPGKDPIVEADNRGSIMAVIRLGNKDIEMIGSGFGGGVAPVGAAGPIFNAMGPGMMPPLSPPPFISGVTSPQYGMPYSGTPIGLTGPPHIPLGIPAGLQKHAIKNHTHMHIPHVPGKFQMHVKQSPGYSYPAPPSRMKIHEQNIHPPLYYGQTHHNKRSQSVK